MPRVASASPKTNTTTFCYSSIKQKMQADALSYHKKHPNDKSWKSVAFRNQFFRNTKGGYGSGDQFLGYWTGAEIKTFLQPILRDPNKTDFKLSNFEKDVSSLVKDPYHEVRLLGWMLLRESSRNAWQHLQKAKEKKKNAKDELQKPQNDMINVMKRNLGIVMKCRSHLKNWDEVDTVATWVLGCYLCEKYPTSAQQRLDCLSTELQLAKVNAPLFSQRLAVVSTQAMIKYRQSDVEIYTLAKLFLEHDHDLMHKAVGWMMREAWTYAGKEKRKNFYGFLDKNYKKMPKVMLRYASEKCTNAEKQKYKQQ